MTPEITRLSNGLTVITDPMPQLESAALGVWVNAGGRNEITVRRDGGKLFHPGKVSEALEVHRLRGPHLRG